MFTWKSESENLTKEKFVKEGQRIFENILKLKCQNLIRDSTNLKFPVSPDLQEQFNKTMFVHLNNSFLKKAAHVISDEFIVELSLEQLGEENTGKTFEDKFFGTLDEDL